MMHEIKHKEYLEKLVGTLRKIIVPGAEEEEYGAQEEHANRYATTTQESAPEVRKRRL